MKCGSQVWFPESQRDVATVIGALFNPLGVAAGQAAALMVSCAGASATAAGAGSGSGASSWELVVGIADADGSVASAPPPTAGSSSEAPQPQQQCAAASDVRGMPELLLTQAAFASASMIGAHSMSATGCSACRLCLSLSLSPSLSLSLSLSLCVCVCPNRELTVRLAAGCGAQWPLYSSGRNRRRRLHCRRRRWRLHSQRLRGPGRLTAG
jgi:hypothetical protein